MAKRRLCSLFFFDHRKHSIIARQIPALLASGKFEILMLDRSKGPSTIDGLEYVHVNVGTAELKFFSRWSWWFLKRILPGRLAHAYWVVLSSLQTLLTTVRFIFFALHTKADVYIAHDIETLTAAVLAGRWHQSPVVYDAHEIASEQLDPHSTRNRFVRRLERRLLPSVDLVITPNQPRAKYYQARYQLRSEPVVVLNCPPAANWTTTDILRERLQLSPDSKIVIYHGGLLPGRALEELVQASQFFEHGIVLVLIGEPNTFFRDVLEPIWRKVDMCGRVHFLPHMPCNEVMEYVASADLGIVIYKNINWNNYLCAPTKIYEYFMAELPFVGADFPEIRNLLTQYPVGFVFDPDDVQSIAAAINRFFALSISEREAMTPALRQARQRFTWEIESQKLIAILDEIR